MSELVLNVATTLRLKRRLFEAGWRYSEIGRLVRFLNSHQPTLDDLGDTERNHLEFVRYLVQTGRITEE